MEWNHQVAGKKRTKAQIEQAIEAETQAVGRYLWDHLERRAPSVLEKRWWDDRILAWAMEDESVKVQMFRFVDVLPMLKTHDSVTRHLQEYFDDVREHLPWAVRMGLEITQPNTVLGRALALNARSNAQRMAKRFIAGSNTEEVLQALRKVRRDGFAFTLDLLGEAVISEDEADAYLHSYLDLVSGLAPVVNNWPEDALLDCDHAGPIPRVNVSVKLSSLYSQFSPLNPAGTAEHVLPRLRELLRSVREQSGYLHVDMEQYSYKNLTLELFKTCLMEPEFRDFADVGIVVQTYLPDADADLKDLLKWVKKRGTPITVRLVKGAYWDYETVVAQSRGWPVPVYQQKSQSDESYERNSLFLMKNYEWLRPALASHNMRSLSHGIACARELGVPAEAYEIQMLYGMGADQAQLLTELGNRVRVYTPFGELIPGMAYLVRRLLENTSNDSFLRQSFAENVSVEELMMKPAEIDVDGPEAETEEATFENEPCIDFSREENRDAMEQALADVADQLGKEYPLIINGRPVDTKGTLISRNPSRRSQTVGKVASASPEDAYDAIAAARRAFKHWSREEVGHRAEYLELVAAEMRNHRFELSAWMIYECAKTWEEADADVAEAIDFCMYYADQMRKLDVPQQCDVPGEENSYYYRPRGVAVVIAPWNFPLAILTGMTAAAVVAGNTVIMKPAEQSSVIAAKLMEMFDHAGLPDGVVNFLPGVGEDIGPELVGSPDIDIIAFTGSRDVGLEINHVASETDSRQISVKKVISEMGGKNAIIVDDDADLDEAVLGVISSAFGYAGQKCSACSRAIVLEDVYDDFLKRLIGATKSLKVGPADSPETTVGPVIDEDAQERIREFLEIGEEEECLAFAAELDEGLAEEGYYIAPHIFSEVEPESRLAQEEIFGPVLAVIKVKDLRMAIQVANGTDYALTAGIYSRSPANLKQARLELEAGNLYLNRGITGALVQRQPFGGFKMSGIGSKAGGPDYLQQFLIPVNVTENTMRRGFAPPADEED